jgi:hypothetical protein
MTIRVRALERWITGALLLTAGALLIGIYRDSQSLVVAGAASSVVAGGLAAAQAILAARRSKVETRAERPQAVRNVPDSLPLPSASQLGPEGGGVLRLLHRVSELDVEDWRRLEEVVQAREIHRFEVLAKREWIVWNAFARAARTVSEAEAGELASANARLHAVLDALGRHGAIPMDLAPHLLSELLNFGRALVIRCHLTPDEWEQVREPFVHFFAREELE